MSKTIKILKRDNFYFLSFTPKLNMILSAPGKSLILDSVHRTSAKYILSISTANLFVLIPTH